MIKQLTYLPQLTHHLFKAWKSGQEISKGNYKKYPGNSLEICRQIIKDRWNGTFFDVGESHFNHQFWIRDFSLSINGLIYAGYKKEVQQTLSWALNTYQKIGRIRNVIINKEIGLDFWRYGVDSLPFLLYSLKTAGVKKLAKSHKDFLNQEIVYYHKTIIHHKSGFAKAIPFSTPKDTSLRTQTCSINTFILFLRNLLENDFPFLYNPFKYHKTIKQEFLDIFWNHQGHYFKNDVMKSDGDVPSADANILPYWTKIVTNKKMLKGSIDAIHTQDLDKPIPLKYHYLYDQKWLNPHLITEFILPNYSGNSIWTFLSPLYFQLELETHPKQAKDHIKQYSHLIEEFQTYPEVLDPKTTNLLKGRFGYGSETGMLWASMMIPLLEKHA